MLSTPDGGADRKLSGFTLIFYDFFFAKKGTSIFKMNMRTGISVVSNYKCCAVSEKTYRY